MRALKKVWIIALLAVSALLIAAAPAHALQEAKVALNRETGGQPTRFTFNITGDEDVAITSYKLMFPDGFDLTEARVETVFVKVEGGIITRQKVEPRTTVEGSGITIGLEPAMEPEWKLILEVYDVMTTPQGGTKKVAITYSVESTGTAGVVTEERQAEVGFSYGTPARAELLARWLDDQPWVTSYNQVKVLSQFFRPQLMVLAVPALFTGWLWSIGLVAVAFPLAIIIGLLFAFMKMSKAAPVRWVSAAYINVIRGTPLFLQIFVAFIGLRMAGVRAPDTVTAVMVLAMNSSAYLAEIFRAGIQSIHKGQFEAASSLGMTYWKSMQYVIIPQTVKRVLPTMTSEFILLFKDTALLAAVGVFELMMYAQNMVSRNANLTPFVVAAAYYLIVTIPLINWVGRLEKKLAIAEGGHTEEEKMERRRWMRWRGVPVIGTQAEASAGKESNNG